MIPNCVPIGTEITAKICKLILIQIIELFTVSTDSTFAWMNRELGKINTKLEKLRGNQTQTKSSLNKDSFL